MPGNRNCFHSFYYKFTDSENRDKYYCKICILKKLLSELPIPQQQLRRLRPNINNEDFAQQNQNQQQRNNNNNNDAAAAAGGGGGGGERNFKDADFEQFLLIDVENITPQVIARCISSVNPISTGVAPNITGFRDRHILKKYDGKHPYGGHELVDIKKELLENSDQKDFKFWTGVFDKLKKVFPDKDNDQALRQVQQTLAEAQSLAGGGVPRNELFYQFMAENFLPVAAVLQPSTRLVMKHLGCSAFSQNAVRDKIIQYSDKCLIEFLSKNKGAIADLAIDTSTMQYERYLAIVLHVPGRPAVLYQLVLDSDLGDAATSTSG